MLSFKQAHDYINRTSAVDIFKRVAIYTVWANFKYQKKFGHDVVVTLAAAFSGPFDGFNNDTFEDHAICELLTITDWGWSSTLNNDLGKWMQKYCKSNDDAMHFNNIGHILSQGKSDEIYSYLQRNAQNPLPVGRYLPEIESLGFLNGGNWPRI
jgi:hypothetical protein